MYESFFELTARPFAAPPLAKRYFAAATAEEARQTLARCVERAEGVGLMMGPAGTGKSLLCQVLAEQFRGALAVALLASGHLCTRRALLQAILFELGLPYRGLDEGDLRLSLIDQLSPRAASAESRAAAGLLLIVDEAHTLPLRLMEELRLITNIVRNGQSRVRLVLVGSPHLEERFASPKLESFNQRVAARCYLEPLDRQQTIDFVRHQIQSVGGNPDRVFDQGALDAVYQAADGIPRLINQVCDHALLLAYAGGVSQLTAAGIEEAWSDLQQLPTPASATAGAPAKDEAGGVIEFGSLDEPLADELPHALPFRIPATQPPREANPLANLERISAELAQLDDFQPADATRPEVELVFPNPFDEHFSEEEVIIDRYSALHADALANRPLVRGAESHELAALLSAAEPGPVLFAAQTPTDSLSIASAARARVEIPTSLPWPGGTPAANQIATSSSRSAVIDTSHEASLNEVTQEDHDLIVIEEPSDHPVPTPTAKPAQVRRKEYRQLFAQLRRG
jgi:type II secretory pathway predicted ATPase ExeA